ncbi:hypothetical protein TMatcc_009202 [Talaromyces marneffei ATCC 18224]
MPQKVRMQFYLGAVVIPWTHHAKDFFAAETICELRCQPCPSNLVAGENNCMSATTKTTLTLNRGLEAAVWIRIGSRSLVRSHGNFGGQSITDLRSLTSHRSIHHTRIVDQDIQSGLLPLEVLDGSLDCSKVC